MAHTIRLLGPWQLRVEGTEQRIHVPVDLSDLVTAKQTAELQRRFNHPTGLASSDRVRIELVYSGEIVDVQCNGTPVQPTPVQPTHNETGVASFEVGSLLEPSNQLTLTLGYGSSDSLKLDLCALVIESGG